MHATERSARLVAVTLDEASIGRANPDLEHERAIAIYDLLEENSFAPAGNAAGRSRCISSITGNRLVFDIARRRRAGRWRTCYRCRRCGGS